MPPVIEVEGLRKEYRRLRGGRTMALDGLDLSVPEGGVFGFLGPNGSGKTTTIRCLLGLVDPTSGRCRVLGADVDRALPSVIGRVGSVVESPALFPSFSGRRNLLLLAGVQGIGARAVDGVLAQVGLTERARDPVRRYSLGMRQRLGIAAALLKDPSLLILDEPANGLDPAGIRAIRDLLRHLGREGRTVFVSSHILSEIQQLCDAVAIVSRGRTVTAGPVHDVLSAGRASSLTARLDDLPASRDALARSGIGARIDGDLLRIDLPGDQGARVSQVLGSAGLWLAELRADEASLEDVFLQLTADDRGVGA